MEKGALLIWLACLILYVQSAFHMGPALLPPNVYLNIVIRSVAILLTCYFVIGPCVAWSLQRWLQKRKVSENETIEKIVRFLPDTKDLVIKSWQLTAHKTGGRRLLLCGKIILLNIFSSAQESKEPI